MMKLFKKILLGFTLTLGASTVAHAQQGGAGCPQSDGSIITLLECGAYQPPSLTPPGPPPHSALSIDAPSETPDGINDLIQYIKNHPYLEDYQKKTMINAIQPTFYRKYFYVNDAPDLTHTIVDRITGEFARVTGLHPSQLILYGVTDTNAHISHSDAKVNITYLLPAFRQLKTKEEKMTALMHENYWVMRPDATYLDIVNSEMTFEAAMQKPKDTTRLIEFAKSTLFFTDDAQRNRQYQYQYQYQLQQNDQNDHPSSKIMQLYLKHDLETEALDGLVDILGNTSSYKLFGKDNLSCFQNLSSKNPKLTYEECRIQFLNYRDSLLRAHPLSMFLAETQGLNGQMRSYGDDYSAVLLEFIAKLNGTSTQPCQLKSLGEILPGVLKWSTQSSSKEVRCYYFKGAKTINTADVPIHLNTHASEGSTPFLGY